MKETDHHIKMALIWGVIIILVFVLFGFLGRIKRHGKQGDPWQVEAQVVKKSTTMRDNGENGSEKVYLIEVYPLNQEGEELSAQTFEVTDTSLDGRFTGAQVLSQIRTGKAYRFKVGWRNIEIIDQDGYYPSIYGAATLLDVPLMEIEEEESQIKESEEMDSLATKEAKEPSTAKAESSETAKESETASTTQKEAELESTTDNTTADLNSTEAKISGIKIEIVEETVKEESDTEE